MDEPASPVPLLHCLLLLPNSATTCASCTCTPVHSAPAETRRPCDSYTTTATGLPITSQFASCRAAKPAKHTDTPVFDARHAVHHTATRPKRPHTRRRKCNGAQVRCCFLTSHMHMLIRGALQIVETRGMSWRWPRAAVQYKAPRHVCSPRSSFASRRRRRDGVSGRRPAHGAPRGREARRRVGRRDGAAARSRVRAAAR